MSLDLQPVREGRRVALRPLLPDDFEDLYAIAANPADWEQHPAKDRTQRAVFVEWFAEAVSSRRALTAVQRDRPEVIGTSRYAPTGNPDEIEIGWTFLARSHWRGSYNRDMKAAMLRHAFGTVGRVLFTVHSQNVRSQVAVLRLGASFVDVTPCPHGKGGNNRYRLDRETWHRSDPPGQPASPWSQCAAPPGSQQPSSDPSPRNPGSGG